MKKELVVIIALLEHIQMKVFPNAYHVQMELIHLKVSLHVLIVKQEHIQMKIKQDAMIVLLEHIQMKEIQNVHHALVVLIHQHLILLHVLRSLLGHVLFKVT